MQLARILLVMTALAVIDSEARWFSFPITFPASFSSLLPFTFNVTTDDTDRGSVTLNIKPKFNREIAGAKVKREVSAVTAEKSGRLNSKESRLFSPLTENWEFGLPSGAGLTLGSVASLAGIIWTVIAKNLEYKKEHGELDGKDSPSKAPIPAPPAPPAPSYGSYNGPSYSSDYSIPPHQKPEKGFGGFSKGAKGIKEIQAQAMKGLTRLVGLRDLNSLLHPKPKKGKKKHMQQQYYTQPVYQSAYTYPQQYAPQTSYEPAPVYAPPPAYEPAPVYAPPPAYEPAPVYALPPAYDPAPVYAPPPAYDPAPAYAPPSANDPAPAYAPPPATDSAPVYGPPPTELPVYAPPPQMDAPTPQPVPAPVYVPPPVTAQFDVLPPPYVPPAQYSSINNLPVPMYSSPHTAREIGENPTQTAQQWNGPSVSSSQSDSLPSGSAPVVESIPVEPPSYISIQTNGFLPIFPSLPDPLAPTDNNETPQMPEDTKDVPTFGVTPPPSVPSSSLPPSAPSSSLLPSRGFRLDDSQPLDPSLSMTIDNSQIAASTVASPNLDGEFELEGTECPEYSIMADDPTPTDSSTENSSMPSGQPLNGA